jgi:hypothetical protein
MSTEKLVFKANGVLGERFFERSVLICGLVRWPMKSDAYLAHFLSTVLQIIGCAIEFGFLRP